MYNRMPGGHRMRKAVSAVAMLLILLSGCTPMGDSLFALQIVYDNSSQVSAIIDMLNNFCYYTEIDFAQTACNSPYSLSVEVPNQNSDSGYSTVLQVCYNRNGLSLNLDQSKTWYLGEFDYFADLTKPFEIGESGSIA